MYIAPCHPSFHSVQPPVYALLRWDPNRDGPISGVPYRLEERTRSDMLCNMAQQFQDEMNAICSDRHAPSEDMASYIDRRIHSHPEEEYYFLMLNDNIIGYCLVYPTSPKCLYLGDFFLGVAWRKRRHGGFYLDLIEQLALECEYSEIQLTCLANNPSAVALYQRCGFQPVTCTYSKKLESPDEQRQ